ncbi:hypothetical protein GE061_018327 [Apolygus lucorum]|uniref:Uncharacterized protein n=1 Tax=Apolygus lucorum TaxID=248454 RepID=A0A6A4JDG4_APOLU|nr:hypothetical protein GE061_018327 [Apolygus lucorum]
MSLGGDIGIQVQEKIKKFEKYHGWRDPDLKGKPRRRSIPNPIKRFYYECKVDQQKLAEEFQRGVGPDLSTSMMGESSSNTVRNVSSLEIPQRVTTSLVYRDHKRKSFDPCRPSRGVVRCAFCDFPYESSRRRRPPHPFQPTVVTLPANLKGGSALEGPSQAEKSGILNYTGQAKRKITRLKRKRSSTELYSGLVAMSPQ